MREDLAKECVRCGAPSYCCACWQCSDKVFFARCDALARWETAAWRAINIDHERTIMRGVRSAIMAVRKRHASMSGSNLELRRWYRAANAELAKMFPRVLHVQHPTPKNEGKTMTTK